MTAWQRVDTNVRRKRSRSRRSPLNFTCPAIGCQGRSGSGTIIPLKGPDATNGLGAGLREEPAALGNAGTRTGAVRRRMDAVLVDQLEVTGEQPRAQRGPQYVPGTALDRIPCDRPCEYGEKTARWI